MFTLDQINKIHEQLGKQKTLPAYLRALTEIGVERSDSFVTDGHSEYFGSGNQTQVSPPVHELFPIADTGNREELLRHLVLHSEGKTSYLEMAKGLADCGTEKWSFNTGKMTVTYYDKDGHELLVEKIEA